MKSFKKLSGLEGTED